MKVHVIDELNPEDIAMLQALYSRSTASVTEHLKKVDKSGSSSFMQQYYVGYGHDSIGDCGTTTIFLENVSLLAAKVVQDNSLYSGQESSTRYIDFSKQKIINPTNTTRGQKIQQDLVDFYLSIQEPLTIALKQQYPLEKSINKITWEKAIKAKVFDISRGFLPAGATTNLSWSTNLRQLNRNLERLFNHPLAEVNELAKQIHSKVSSKYPSSLKPLKTTDYLKTLSPYNYIEPNNINNPKYQVYVHFNRSLTSQHIYALEERGKYDEIPKNLGNVARFIIKGQLDFGSFRDLQRHRNGYCPMPLLTTRLGFHDWYLKQLEFDKDLLYKAKKLVNIQLQNTLDSLAESQGVTRYDMQYYIPLGFNVNYDLDYDLGEMIYVAELRSRNTVHPTLRQLAQNMCSSLYKKLPIAKVYEDTKPNDLSIKRGSQDIKYKEKYIGNQ